MASAEALRALSRCCYIPENMANSLMPVHIVSENFTSLSLEPLNDDLLKLLPTDDSDPISMYDNIRNYCAGVDYATLLRLRLQLALYVHPVVRGDEVPRFISESSLGESFEPENRHVAQAELRSVYTMFINALIPPVLIGDPNVDDDLFRTLRSIMHVTSRELDRYSGQLRQFIVDDKGMYSRPFQYLLIIYLLSLSFALKVLYLLLHLDYEDRHSQICKCGAIPWLRSYRY